MTHYRSPGSWNHTPKPSPSPTAQDRAIQEASAAINHYHRETEKNHHIARDSGYLNQPREAEIARRQNQAARAHEEEAKTDLAAVQAGTANAAAIANKWRTDRDPREANAWVERAEGIARDDLHRYRRVTTDTQQELSNARAARKLCQS
jgi:hypothetical protein